VIVFFFDHTGWAAVLLASRGRHFVEELSNDDLELTHICPLTYYARLRTSPTTTGGAFNAHFFSKCLWAGNDHQNYWTFPRFRVFVTVFRPWPFFRGRLRRPFGYPHCEGPAGSAGQGHSFFVSVWHFGDGGATPAVRGQHPHDRSGCGAGWVHVWSDSGNEGMYVWEALYIIQLGALVCVRPRKSETQ